MDSQLHELDSCAALALSLDFKESSTKEEKKMTWENVCKVKRAKLHTMLGTDCTTAYLGVATEPLVFYGKIFKIMES